MVGLPRCGGCDRRQARCTVCGLQALHDALTGTERAGTAMRRLSKDIVSTVLSDLASGRRPVSHEALDALPEGKVVEHIRSGTSRWSASNDS
ncbi:hypothetical protein ACFRKD_21075 [Streptomyces niveus]|uniref:hypothetical protein n=1 Tax=Streptomyces niveus TaxID=193462 RepID=UPI003666EC41